MPRPYKERKEEDVTHAALLMFLRNETDPIQ